MKVNSYNIIVLEISCFNGMAGSKRVRNLFEPLMQQNLISVYNLIFRSKSLNIDRKKGIKERINYEVIDYKSTNIFTIYNFFSKGLSFIKRSKQLDATNIIYNYGGPNVKNILFLLFAKMIGYKIICDIVEDNRYESITNYLNGIKLKSSLILLKFTKFYANALIGISEHLFNRLQILSDGKIPVYLVPISVNLSFFQTNNTTQNNGELKIFYGGSFNQKDGLEYLIPAFDEISNIHQNIELILSGYSVKTDKKKVDEIIEKTRNKDRIIYKGFLENNEYYKLLNSCDIFCMTRENSEYANAGFPFKLGEFLASGKAVVATNIGDIPKYLTNEINALVINPNSKDEIVAALSALIENPVKIKTIGMEGRKIAEQYFDSKKVSLKLFSIIQSL